MIRAVLYLRHVSAKIFPATAEYGSVKPNLLEGHVSLAACGPAKVTPDRYVKLPAGVVKNAMFFVQAPAVSQGLCPFPSSRSFLLRFWRWMFSFMSVISVLPLQKCKHAINLDMVFSMVFYCSLV